MKIVLIAGISALAAVSNARGLSSERKVAPLNIGVMAVGPRNLPDMPDCGSYPTDASYSTLYYAPGLREGLKKLGYSEDQFRLDVKQADIKTLKRIAADFIKSHDIIVAVATSVVNIAKEETAKLGERPPIVFPDISDPTGSGSGYSGTGYADSLEHPGHNLTGLSPNLTQSTVRRMIYFQRLLKGRLKRVLILRNPSFGPSAASMKMLRDQAPGIEALKDIEFVDQPVGAENTASDVARIMSQARSGAFGQIDGFFFLNDTYVISNADQIFNTMNALNIPIMGIHSFMADWGAVASYPSDPYGDGVKLAGIIDRIWRGEKPADIPIDKPSEDEGFLVVNLKRAKDCLRLDVDESLAAEASRVLR